MDSCSINLNVVESKIRDILGGDTLLYSCTSDAFNNGYTQGFTNWYRQFNEEIPAYNTTDVNEANKLAQRIVDYYKRIPAVGNDTRDFKGRDKIALKGYPTINDREEGKRHAVGQILDVFAEVNAGKKEVTGIPRLYYLKALKSRWNNLIVDEIAKRQNKLREEVLIESRRVYKEIKDKTSKYATLYEFFDEQLGGKDKGIIAQNLLAVYKELNTSNKEALAYMDELLCDKRLQFIRSSETESEEDAYNRLVANGAQGDFDVEIDDFSYSDTVDDSIAKYGSHQGLYSTFTMHLGEKLTVYFNTLERYKRTGNPNETPVRDTDTRFGIPERMDANRVLSMLYAINTEFTTLENTIAAIKKVAKYIDEFACFHKLAEDLENDADLATELRTVIAKTVMAKMQLRVAGKAATAPITNEESDRKATMLFNLFADCRESLPHADVAFITSKSDILKSDINTSIQLFKKLKTISPTVRTTYETYVGQLTDLLRSFYPSLQPEAIISYIELNNNAHADRTYVKKLENILSLLELVENTCKKVTIVRNNYAEAREEYSKKLSEFNKQNIARKVENAEVPFEKPSLNIYDFVQDNTNNCLSVIDKLMQYSVIRLQLNHSNAMGNNASDVINNNYLTRLENIFRQTYKDSQQRLRNKALEAWGKERLRSKQYKYSSILLRQKDENNNLISYGIFDIDASGTLYLTNEAEELLKIYLFDGSQNLDENKKAPYSEMGQGGYLPTAFMAFFKPKEIYGKEVPLANYFFRTPSDAPKNFIMRGSKINIDGFLEPISSSDNEASKYIDTIKELTAEERDKYIAKKPANYGPKKDEEAYAADKEYKEKHDKKTRETTINTIVNGIVNGNMPLQEDTYVTREDGTYLTVYVAGTSTEPAKAYVFKGNIKKSSNSDVEYLGDAKLIGFRNYASKNAPSTKVIHKKLDTAIRAKFAEILPYTNLVINGTTYNKIKYKVNRNHRMFKVLRNIFKQEMLDVARAIDYYFDTNEQGWVKSDKGDSVEKEITVKDAAKIGIGKNADKYKGYSFYHTDIKGRVLVKDADGEYRLPGLGFHSNRFTLSVTDEKGNVKQRNFLDKLIGIGYSEAVGKDRPFQLLYGGDETKKGSFLHVIKRNGNTRDRYDIETTSIEDGEVIDVDIDSNKYQSESVDNAIEDFVTEFVSQAFDAITAKRKFISENIAVNAISCADFALNNFVHLCQSDDLFEGNTKYYADAQTILKRAKEIQGSGVPYGISDYLNESSADPVTIQDGYLTKQTIGDTQLFKGTILEGLTQRDKFYGVTITNTKMTNTVALERLKDYLVKQKDEAEPGKHALHEADVEELLYGPLQKDEVTGKLVRRGGFTEQKVNDAQSYITFQEFVRRVANKGQFKKYQPLIEKVLDDGYILKERFREKKEETGEISRAAYKQLSTEEKSKYREKTPLTAKDLKAFIQVQKNFYYDMWFDEEFKEFVPRQIKNAEFVLIPRLIEGTELEQVYNLMIDLGIDQLNTVETSKAANRELLTLWDNEGNFDDTDFKLRVGSMKMTYDYKYLYSQQETPQHVNSENKAAIQLVKKIVDNIPPGHKLADKKKEYLNLLAYNVEQSFLQLMKDFGVELENGNIPDGTFNINFKKFADKFKDEMLRLGADSNMMDYFTYDDDGNPLMYAYINTALKKLESVAQSLFNNNITRQKLPGFHVAQVTNIGWNKLSDSLDDVSYSKKLEYHPNEYVNINNSNDKIIQREYDKLSEEDKKKYKLNGVSPVLEVLLPKGNFGIDMNSEHYKNMTDDEILAELKKEGLDTIIGYRIPTEGKQSMAIMKVVGFTDDAYGSTIVVPNDWVSQTGSDFDIDSVYGVQFPTRTLKSGKVIRIKYVNNPTYGNWIAYLQKELKKGINSEELSKELGRDISGEIERYKQGREVLMNELNAEFKELQEKESEYWHDLPEKLKEATRDADKAINKKYKKEIEAGENKQAIYVERLDKYKRILAAERDNNTARYNKYKELIDNLINTIDEINDYVDNLEDRLKEGYINLKDLSQEHKDSLDNFAKESGLMTYSDYVSTVKANPNAYNSRRARQSRICQLMLDILGDPTSLEENLSRSNFDDIIYWRDALINKNIKNARKYRSAYNIFDQIAYQEDATSGLALKGLSVSLDTFCSVCNTVRPTLTKPVLIIYDDADFGHPAKNKGELGSKYSETAKEVSDRFNVPLEETRDGGFVIRHDTYGWTKDNKNVAGKILTSYSSQTTAHILDAIKEGAIPGVNIYTFPAYKTLVNIGSDYKVAVSFIMQPGIARIIENYESTNSVFSSNFGNPVHKSIRDIAKRLGVPFKNTDRIQTVIKEINKKFGTTNKGENTYGDVITEVFGYGKGKETPISFAINDKSAAKIPINARLQAQRLNNEGIFADTTPVEGIDGVSTKGELNQLIFDLGTIIIFNRLNNISSQISSVARCCNPDKFGAKQTVFATNRVFEDIRDISSTYRSKENIEYDEEGNVDVEATKKRKPILTVDGVHILEAIYPGVFEGTQEDPIAGMRNHIAAESKYPPLFNYLKYASASSILINRRIFDTQDIMFVNAVNGLATKLSGTDKRLDESTYNSMQEYLLSRLYSRVPFLANPVNIVTINGNKTIQITTNGDGTNFLVDDEPLRIKERNRLAGFNYRPTVDVERRRKPTELEKKENPNLDAVVEYEPFTVADINHPTKEEIDKYVTLTPGQKIKWIKDNIRECGIFEFVEVSLLNPNARGNKAGMHTLEYKEDSLSPEVAYHLFNLAFYDNNPLYQLAAIDMIKYAFLIEGGRMSSKGILKLISNVPIYTDLGINGTGIMGSMKTIMDNIKAGTDPSFFGEGINRVYEDYIRSHPDLKGIRTMYINNDANYTNKYGITVPKNITIPIYISEPLRIKNPATEEIKNKNEEAIQTYRERLSSAGIGYVTENLDVSDEDEDVDANKMVYNNYVKMEIGKAKRLYKIVYVENRGVILYPINKLDPFEHTDWSARESNNVAPESRYYEALINEFTEKTNSVDFGSSLTELRGEALKKDPTLATAFYKPYKTIGVNASTKTFSLEALANDRSYYNQSGAQSLLTRLKDHFSKIDAAPLTVMNRALGDFIFTPGVDYRSIQTININGPVKLAIEKINPDNYEALMKKGRTAISKIKDENLKNLLLNLKELKFRANDLYIVYRVSDSNKTVETNNSTQDSEAFKSAFLDKSTAGVVRYINRSAKKGDEISKSTSYMFNINGITGDEKTHTEDKKLTIYRELARYAENKSRELCDTFNYFDDGESMLSSHVLDMLNSRIPAYAQTQRRTETKYLRVINEVRSLLELLAPYKSAITTEENEDIRFYIGKIQKALGKLETLNIEEASHTFNEYYLKNLSNDPVIKSNLIKVMDSYYRTHGSMWKFNDILESSNPLLQIILKDVMADIEAKRQQTTMIKRSFHSKMSDIKRRAAADGVTIDMSKVIDEESTALRQKYSADLINKVRELATDRREMESKYGQGSLQHLQADLEYLKFVSTHFHQEALPEYYKKKIELLEYMLNPYNRSRPAYINYMKLQYRRRSITRYKSPSDYTEEDIKELNRIDEVMYALRAPYEFVPLLDNTIFGGKRSNFVGSLRDMLTVINSENLDYDIEDLFNIDEEDLSPRAEGLRRLRTVVFDYKAARQLDKVLTKLNKLEDDYFTYESKDYFEEQLEKNLRIIEQAENRGPNGRPTATFEELENNPSYQRARKWLFENAKFEFYNRDRDNEGTLGKLIHDALNRMKLRGNGKPILDLNKNLKAKLKAIRDEYGIVDVSKLTPEELNEYRTAITINCWNSEAGLAVPFDRLLINSIKPKLDEHGYPIRYSRLFYNHAFPVPASRSVDYYKVITDINNILKEYYDYETGIVHLSKIEDTPEGIAKLNKLADLYAELDAIREVGSGGTVNSTFLEKNVDTTIAREVYEEEHRAITKIENDKLVYTVSKEYVDAWRRVNYRFDPANNTILTDNENKPVLNSDLYGRFEIKEEVLAEHPEYLDKQFEADILLLNDAFIKTPTRYWWAALAEQRRKKDADPNYDLQGWINSNYYFDPRSHKYELLPIWTTNSVNPTLYKDGTYQERWVPRAGQRTRKVKDGWKIANGRRIYLNNEDKSNHEYKPDATLGENYIVGSDNGAYDTNVELNKYEQEVHDLFKNILISSAKTERALKRAAAGKMPTRRLTSNTLISKAIELVKGNALPTSVEEADEIIKDLNKHKKLKYKTDNEVEHIFDYNLELPMSQLLKDKELGSVEFTEEEPKRSNFEDTPEGYNQFLVAHNEWIKQRDEADAKNKEIHQKLADKDWEGVLDEYLDRIGNYNSIIENKDRLYYLLDCLEKQDVYIREHGYYGDLKTRGNGEYVTTRDEDLIKHYKDFLKRLLFDEWKENDGFLTVLGKHLQSYSSANYMMLNFRAGVANVTLGSWGIIAEAAAGSYLNMKELRAGTIEWRNGCIGMARKIYDSDSVNVQDAIIKFFKVIDYDEIAGRPDKLTYDKWYKRLVNGMYAPQTIGEHFMQNSVLFALLKSHKLVDIPNDSKGVGTTFMNREEYISFRENNELLNILTEEERASYDDFMNSIKDDPNVTKDYVWRQKDALTEWLYLHYDDDKRKAFIARREGLRKQYIEEFNSFTNIFDQLELAEDGYMGFKEGSKLAELNTKFTADGQITQAIYLTGQFSQRVKSVNKKIHGVYDKLGRAYIEHHWLGGLIMQYHKHLPMGILKRYRIQGYYNEARGTVEKGMAKTLWDAFYNPYSLNNRKVQQKLGFNRDEAGAVQALFFHIRHTLDYCLQIRETYKVLPEYEKGNVRRNMAELAAVTSGALFTFALLLAGGGDDNDSIPYNFFLYEADRLSSEAFLYNPFGLYSEFKVLMGTPIAAQSIVGDIMKGCFNLMKGIFGDDSDDYYKSGRFAGRSKLSVYFERRIPAWYGIRGVLETPANNHYYKIGSTGIKPTVVARWLAEGILGKD